MNIKNIIIKNNELRFIIIEIEYYVLFGLFTRKKRAYAQNHTPKIHIWYWLGSDIPIDESNEVTALYRLKELKQAKTNLNKVKAEYEAQVK